MMTSRADEPDGWNDFVVSCVPPPFEQTSWWARVETEDGWDARYLVASDSRRMAAGALVLVRRQRGVGRVGYVVRGPLVARDVPDSGHVRQSLAAGLKSLARKERLTLLVVVPPYDGDALASTLLEAGFLPHPSSLPPTGLSPGTVTVDLRRDIRQIEQDYRRTLRQEVNRAGKLGLTVSLGTGGDLARFWETHLQLCRRRGVATNVPSFAYVCRAWEEFHSQGRAWLFNANFAGQIVCSLLCLGAGQWCYAWRIGWAPGSEKVYATQAVFARAIREAREAGFHFFDFMQIHPDDVERLKRGERLTTPTAGMTFFKLGFGGSVRAVPPAVDWFPNRAVRFFMRAGGLRLASSGALSRLARPHG